MKRIVKQSIWVIFLNIFIGTFVLAIIIGLVKYLMGETDFLSIFTVGILGTFIGFVLYGLIFLIPLLLLLLFSALIFVKNKSDISDVKRILIIEFIVVSISLTYMAIKFDFYLWFAFILIFGISQYRRFTIIINELKTQPNNV